MDAFLSNLNNTAVSSLVARGLKVTGVTLTTSASFSPSALPALYSVSTTSSLHVNPSAYYAIIAVGCSIAVAFVACCIVVCVSSWGQKLGKRPPGPRAVIGAKQVRRARGSPGTVYSHHKTQAWGQMQC